jgi:hypothetical protein
MFVHRCLTPQSSTKSMRSVLGFTHRVDALLGRVDTCSYVQISKFVRGFPRSLGAVAIAGRPNVSIRAFIRYSALLASIARQLSVAFELSSATVVAREDCSLFALAPRRLGRIFHALSCVLFATAEVDEESSSREDYVRLRCASHKIRSERRFLKLAEARTCEGF